MIDHGPSLMAFWPFGSGAMLWWGLAAAAPIIIHLLNRRRTRETPWAAMQFLLAAIRKNSRRVRLEHWLLLAIRTLILVVFALALADPIFRSAISSMGLSSGQTLTVLVIDGSYSMAYRNDDRDRFSVAKNLLTEIVQQSVQGDGFTLLMMAEPPQAIVNEAAFAKDDVLSELDELQVTHGGASLVATLEEAARMIQLAGEKHARLTRFQVCIATDLGSTTWGALDSPAVRARLASLAQKAKLVLLDVSGEAHGNLAVTHLEAEDALHVSQQRATFRAVVENLGNDRETARQITGYVNGQPVFSDQIDLDPGASVTVRFSHTLTAARDAEIKVELDQDQLPIDDVRWFSIVVREKIAVLCIEGQHGAAANIRAALEAAAPGQRIVKADVAAENALLERDLSDYQAIFLCNVSFFDADEARVLYDYAAAGGGLAVFLGDQVQLDAYNQALASEDLDRRILPARLISLVQTGKAGVTLHSASPEHPVSAPFQHVPRSGLFTIPSYRYIRLDPLDESVQRVFDFTDTRDPALLAGRIGSGRCLLFATAASTRSMDRREDPPLPWTALPTVKDYVSLAQEMIRYLVAGNDSMRNLLVGQSLRGTLSPSQGYARVMLSDPAAQVQRLATSSHDGWPGWQYPSARRRGVYSVVKETSDELPQLYAVNIDTQESQLEKIERDQLPHQFSLEFERRNEPIMTAPSGESQSIFRFLLSSVLILVMLESLLAARFGRIG